MRDGRSFEWVAAAMRISDQWIRKWWTRFRLGGKHWSALEDGSRRPHRIHTRRHEHVDAVLAAKAQFPHMGPMKLKIVAQIQLGHDAIARILREARLVKLVKRHWYQYRRFQRPFPNYLWQLDFKEFFRGDGRKVWAEGVCEGGLAMAPRGSGGFGYDPAFVPKGWDRTMAELTDEEKDWISHRGRAFRALRDLLAGSE